MAKIFISYRREDTEYPAQSIYEKIVARFGRDSVVFDVDTIPIGFDFRDYLNQEVSKCDVLLAVIGDRWLDILKQRLNEPKDFVRIEIQAALERDIPVVPVLVKNASVPSVTDLPPELSELAYKQATEVRAGSDYQNHLRRLISGLDNLITGQPSPKDSTQAEKKRAENERRRKKELEQKLREENQKKVEKENQRLAEEKRKLDEKQKRIEAARRKEETSNRIEAETKRKVELERNRKEKEIKRLREPKTDKSKHPQKRNAQKFVIAAGIIIVLITAIWWFSRPPAVTETTPIKEVSKETEQINSTAVRAKVETEIAPEAELVDFAWGLKDFQGLKTLHFNVALKNISQHPQRFRVHILSDNSKNVGGYIPRKANKFIEPGEKAVFVYPVNNMPSYPTEVFLKITTMEKIKAENHQQGQLSTDVDFPKIEGRWDLIDGRTFFDSGSTWRIYKATIIIERISKNKFGYYLAQKVKDANHDLSPIGRYGVMEVKEYQNGILNLRQVGSGTFSVMMKTDDRMQMTFRNINTRQEFVWQRTKLDGDVYISLRKTLKHTESSYRSYLSKQYKKQVH